MIGMLGKGTKNIAASGAVNTRTLRAGSSGMGARISAGAAPISGRQRPTKSMAGIKADKDAYIQKNTSGYGKIKEDVRPSAQRREPLETPQVESFNPRYFQDQVRINDRSKSKYNPFRQEDELAKMLR